MEGSLTKDTKVYNVNLNFTVCTKSSKIRRDYKLKLGEEKND